MSSTASRRLVIKLTSFADLCSCVLPLSHPSGFFRSDDLTSALPHNIKRIKRKRGPKKSTPGTKRIRPDDTDTEEESELSSLSESELDTKSTLVTSAVAKGKKRPRPASSPTQNPKPSKILRKVQVEDQSVLSISSPIVEPLGSKETVEVLMEDVVEAEEEEGEEEEDDDDDTESYAPTLKERKKLNTPLRKKKRGGSRPSETFKRKASKRLEGSVDSTAGTPRRAEFPPTTFSKPKPPKKKESMAPEQEITEKKDECRSRSPSLYSDYSSDVSSDQDEDQSRASSTSTQSSLDFTPISHSKPNDFQLTPFDSPPRSPPSFTPQGSPPTPFSFETYRYDRSTSPLLIFPSAYNHRPKTHSMGSPPSPFRVATGFFQTTLDVDLGASRGIDPRAIEPNPIFV